MDSRTAFHRRTKPPSLQCGGIRRGLLIGIGAVVLLAGGCILAAWLAAPWGVNRVLAQYTAAGPERSARVASVRFNPLTLEAELQMLQLEDGRAQSTFSASSVSLGLSFRSVLERRLIFDSILIESPTLDLRSLQQGSDLTERLIDEWLPTISIEQLTVTGGRFATTADTTTLPLQLRDIDIRLAHFDGRTEPSTAVPARLTLRATTSSGAQFDSDGVLEAGLARSTGRFALAGFDLETLRPSLRAWLPVTALNGTLDLNGGYALTAALSAPVLELTDGDAQLRDFALIPVTGFTVRADELNATANLRFSVADGTIPASGRVEMTDAQLTLSDSSLTPPQTLEFADAAVLLSVAPSRDGLSINLGGKLIDAGEALLMARIPTDRAAERSLSFDAADLPAAKLSSYTAQAFGRGLSSGRADIKLDYSISAQRVSGALHLVARELRLAATVVSGQTPGDDASLDLAAALLVNADGVIDLNLPFAGNAGSVRNAALDALRARLATLTETPFDAVAPLIVGDVDAVRAVPFVPGDAALGDQALATIDQLANVLNARPRLSLRVHRGYNASADRNELARRQIQLHVLLATAGPSAQARPQPVDFNAPRAQDVLDEFAGERLPAERVDEIAAQFDCSEAIAVICRRAYYAALFNALVANEEITEGALNRLGRFRAQSIVEALTQRGIDSARIEVVMGAEVIDSPFGIGLPVDLTVAALRDEIPAI